MRGAERRLVVVSPFPRVSALLFALLFTGVCSVAPAQATTAPAAVKGLNAWYDLSDSSTLTFGANTVLQWNDKSGNNFTLLPDSPTTAFPVFNASGIGGLTDVAFSGSTTFLHATMSAAPGANPPHTIFVVGKGQTNVAGAFVAYSGPNPGTGANENSVVGTAAYNATSQAWWFGGNAEDSGYGGGVNNGAAHIFSKVYDGATIHGNYDGSSVFTQSQSYNLVDTHIDVGSQNEQESVGFTGEIGEVIIYNSALSTTNYKYVEGYLACKWGLQANLPAGHPYKSACPSGNPLTSGFTGPTAWYDGSDASTIVRVQAVNAVSDKSGKANTINQSSSSAQPYLTTINSQQALMFGGGQQLLSSTTNTLATGSNPSTIFAVAAFTGSLSGTYAQIVIYGNNNTNLMRATGKVNNSGRVLASEYSRDVTGAGSWSTAPAIDFTSCGALTETVALNGATASTLTNTPNTSASAALLLGSQSSMNYWIGPIYEVLIYNATLSTTERQFVEGYLACKWGLQGSLPPGHPYASSCPMTATANLSLVLSVLPTGLQPPGADLTYNTTFTNASGTLVYTPVVNCTVPANTWFKIGTVTTSLGSTGLAATITYSNDGGSTFTYTPVSGAGGAASGYDASVTAIRWTLAGALGPASAVNSGNVSYGVGIE